MPDTHHFFYLSSASELMAPDGLTAVLDISRRNNERDDLSGMLLYSGGTFIQYLEGPAAAIEATKARITIDPRHTGIIRLTEGPVAKRLFPDWSMGFESAKLRDQDIGGFDLSWRTLNERVPENLPVVLRTMMHNVYETGR